MKNQPRRKSGKLKMRLMYLSLMHVWKFEGAEIWEGNESQRVYRKGWDKKL